MLYLCVFVSTNCSFTGSVKLKGIIVIGGEEETHPSVMKLYALLALSRRDFLNFAQFSFYSHLVV